MKAKKRVKKTYKQAQEAAEKYNGQLLATDFCYHDYVYVATDERFMAWIPSAFAVEWHDWFMIFAEHHNPFLFHENDVTAIFGLTMDMGDFPKLDNLVSELK